MLLKLSKITSELPTSKVYYSNSGVTKTSALSEHGLDSLDAIEISMQIEEDLGYTISAETLPSFTKVNHYITYIEQVEAFKR
jgi:acyl carrier protein